MKFIPKRIKPKHPKQIWKEFEVKYSQKRVKSSRLICNCHSDIYLGLERLKEKFETLTPDEVVAVCDNFQGIIADAMYFGKKMERGLDFRKEFLVSKGLESQYQLYKLNQLIFDKT